MFAIYLEVKRESLNLDEKKSLIYNVGIGLVIGIVFFTKQNMGVFAILTTGTVSIIKCIMQKKILVKEILAKMLGFFIFTEIMMVYFIVTNTFGAFWDYCVLGIFDFGKENLLFGLSIKHVFLGLVLTLAMGFAKDKKDMILVIEIIAQIFMCGIIYPLSNEYHIILSMLMIYPIIMRLMNHVVEFKNIYYVMQLVFFATIIILPIPFFERITNYTEEFLFGTNRVAELYAIILALLMVAVGLCFVFEKYDWMKRVGQILLALSVIFYANAYKEIVKVDFTDENMRIYSNLGYSKEQMDYIREGINYILEKEKEGYNVYVISADASYYTAALRRNAYRFDLTLYGSLGSKGEQSLIDDVSKLTNAVLIKNKDLMHQEPEKFDEYIKENYKEVDSFGDMKVYVTPDITVF